MIKYYIIKTIVYAKKNSYNTEKSQVTSTKKKAYYNSLHVLHNLENRESKGIILASSKIYEIKYGISATKFTIKPQIYSIGIISKT